MTAGDRPNPESSCKACREYVDWQVKVIEEKFKAVEAARVAFEVQLEAHLERLNNEAGRIREMTNKTVSADTWTGFIKQYEERHGILEKRVNDSATSKEFLDYKESTIAALKLAEGKNQGISLLGGIIYSVVVAAGVAFGIWATVAHIK